MKKELIVALLSMVLIFQILLVFPPVDAETESASNDEIAWLNPIPTNVNLYGCDWSNKKDYALVVGDGGTILKFYPQANWKSEHIDAGCRKSLYSVSYSPDESYALITGNGGTLIKYDGEKIVHLGINTTKNLRRVFWDPSGNAYITGYSGTLYKFDGRTFERIHVNTTEDLFDGTWTSENFAIIVGNGGVMLKMNSSGIHQVNTGFSDFLYAIDWHSSHHYGIAVGGNGIVIKYDGEKVTNIFRGTDYTFRDVVWSPSGDRAIIVGLNKSSKMAAIFEYNPTTNLLKEVNNNILYVLRSAIYEPDETFVFVCGAGGVIAEIAGNSITQYFKGDKADMTDIAWSPDGNDALIVGYAGTAYIYSNDTLIKLSTNTSTKLMGISWHPNGNYAIVVGQGGMILKYNRNNMSFEKINNTVGSQYLYDVSFKPTGEYALIVGEYGTVIKLEGYKTTKLIFNLTTGGRNLFSVAWKPNAEFAFIVGASGLVIKYEEIALPPKYKFTLLSVPGMPPVSLWDISWSKKDSEIAFISGDRGICVRYNRTKFQMYDTETQTFLYGVDANPISGEPTICGRYGFAAMGTPLGWRYIHTSTDVSIFKIRWKKNGNYFLLVGQHGIIEKHTIEDGPHAIISHPKHLSSFEPEQKILFDCTNSTLPYNMDVHVEWYSNISGFLGKNARFLKKLDYGLHRIWVYVNGTKGKSSYAEVEVEVKTPNRPPSVNIESPKSGIYNDTDMIEFSANGTYDPDKDDLRYYWISNRTGYLGSKRYFSTTLNVGMHKITLWVDDSHGHNVSASVNITIIRHNNPPKVVISSPINGSIYSEKELILFNCENTTDPDGDSVKYYWESNITGYLSSAERFMRSLSPGLHKITLWVDDSMGANVSESIIIEVKPTNRPPEIVITSPQDNATVNGTITIEGRANDIDGIVTSVFLKIDYGGWIKISGTTNWKCSVDTSTLSNGEHYIYVRAYDGIDYSDVVSIKINVKNILHEFTVRITSPEDGKEVSGKVRIYGTATVTDGEIERVEISIDDKEWIVISGTNAWEYTWDTTKIDDGIHIIKVRAYDGKQYSEPVEIKLNVKNEKEADYTLIIAVVLVIIVISLFTLIIRKKDVEEDE